MDQNEHPHLKLVKTPPQPLPEPELHYYKHDPTYNYDLDMPKSDVLMLVVGGVLIGTLVGIVAVGLWGGLSLL